MSIIEALERVEEFLKDHYSGDVEDDLSLVINRLKRKYPQVANDEL